MGVEAFRLGVVAGGTSMSPKNLKLESLKFWFAKREEGNPSYRKEREYIVSLLFSSLWTPRELEVPFHMVWGSCPFIPPTHKLSSSPNLLTDTSEVVPYWLSSYPFICNINLHSQHGVHCGMHVGSYRSTLWCIPCSMYSLTYSLFLCVCMCLRERCHRQQRWTSDPAS